MDQKKLPEYIKALRRQRMLLKELEALLESGTEALRWIAGHATSEGIVAEAESVAEAVWECEEVVGRLVRENGRLLDDFKRPPQSLIDMMKRRPRQVKESEEYEEI